jgi:hypothetical protein
MKERNIDRSTWPRGPWDNETDRAEWRDKATGIPCLMVRNFVGAWCGYAAVPPGHPWHGMHYSDLDVRVHGGLTYSDRCDEDGAICHVPREGEPADVWWLGFDTAQSYDAPPGMIATGLEMGLSLWEPANYKGVSYVRAQVRKLAAQIAAAKR